MAGPEHHEFRTTQDQIGSRIDSLIRSLLPKLSRTFIQRLIRQNNVLVDGHSVKSSYKIAGEEIVSVTIPEPVPVDLVPQNIPLEIIFEDEDLIVVNKPAGLVVHPGAGVPEGTLANALLYHCKNLSGIGGSLRPGIVHRLDKNTSGLLVAAKNDLVHRKLSTQFAEKTVNREYLAMVWHQMSEREQEISTYLNRSKHDRKLFSVSPTGKKAITVYRVLSQFSFLTLLAVRLQTGRTHQIRAHLNFIGHPVFGDPQYHGRLKQVKQLSLQSDKILARHYLQLITRQALHAHKLGFIHPLKQEKMFFQVPLPADFQMVLDEVNEQNPEE